MTVEWETAAPAIGQAAVTSRQMRPASTARIGDLMGDDAAGRNRAIGLEMTGDGRYADARAQPAGHRRQIDVVQLFEDVFEFVRDQFNEIALARQAD